MRKAIAKILAAAAILAAGSLNHASAQDTSFDIVRFQIEGNIKRIPPAAGEIESLFPKGIAALSHRHLVGVSGQGRRSFLSPTVSEYFFCEFFGEFL